MIAIMLVCVLVALIAAALLWRYLKPTIPSVISLGIVGLVVASALLGFGSYKLAFHVSQRGAIGGFHQFLNGSITHTDVVRTVCSEDGACAQTYSCDPYEVPVVTTSTDSNGNTTTTITYMTEYRNCPYATEEFTYTANDSLGKEHLIADHIFADHPREWRAGSGIDVSVPRGVPPLWQQMKDGVDSGNLYPITLTSTYDNFILADESSILRAHSSDITQLKKLNLLPDHTRNMHIPIYNQFTADKFQFVGLAFASSALWQQSLMYFNAALGMTYQGDLHVVAIKASAIPNNIDPHQYFLALKAYWLNDLGKYALPKNGIVLVLGLDDSGQTVLWSQAGTGMPIGNGSMLSALTDLSNTPFTPANLFGDTTAHVSTVNNKAKAVYNLGGGLVPQIIMQEFPFARACMKCTSKADQGTGQHGFTYLSTALPIPTHIQVYAILIDLVILAIAWGGFSYLFAEEPVSSSYVRSRQYLHV
jgi:hypothetical protein